MRFSENLKGSDESILLVQKERFINEVERLKHGGLKSKFFRKK